MTLKLGNDKYFRGIAHVFCVAIFMVANLVASHYEKARHKQDIASLSPDGPIHFETLPLSGTDEEREAMLSYCYRHLSTLLGKKPGVIISLVKVSGIIYAGKHLDGGNAYRIDDVYSKGGQLYSWRCHRFNDPGKSWQDISVELVAF